MTPQTTEYIVSGASEADISKRLAWIRQELESFQFKPTYSITIEGRQLELCLSHPPLRLMLLHLCKHADAVICARCTPLQKAGVVRLVQATNQVVLAVGDGGNDIPMIQAADVGVGISGREGLYASKAADYSLPKFWGLARLLLIHGRYSYQRNAFIAQYSFYKSLFFVIIQIAFAFVSQFSGASYFDSMSITLYNLTYTSIPVICFALHKDVRESTVMALPGLYRTRTSEFTWYSVLRWTLLALFQGAVICYVSWHTTLGPNYVDVQDDQLAQSLSTYSACIVIQTAVISLCTVYWTWLNVFAVVGSLVAYVFLSLVFSLLPIHLTAGMFFLIFSDYVFYLRVVLLTVICCLPLCFTPCGKTRPQQLLQKRL